jgi:cell division septum initiation protein DivIVA
MSSNNIDTQLNNIFDEDNTPPEFDVVLRGFDRTQVQDYLDGLRNEVKQSNKQLEKAKNELNAKNRQLQERERRVADIVADWLAATVPPTTAG